ncbi:solute carrier family 35 member SLC35F1/F2/F6 [Phlebopus sp. FC_14]|nr:solute carrier family 35 member SLC35F1/F2/F6 [Phlebopus sp. FC_14]
MFLPPSECEHILKRTARPPISFDSPTAFMNSLWARFLSLWTSSFAYSLIGGQLLSVCLTCTSVITAELVDHNWALPCTQIFFTYLSLFVVYTPYTVHRYGFQGWRKVLLHDGWRYFLLAICDVEGNFLAVTAYQYTDILSCMLLDAWAIPVSLFLCWLYMKTRYHWTQIFGIIVSICGLALLVLSDFVTGKDGHAEDRAKGDTLIIAAATCFGIVNATEEFLVRRSPIYEVVGQVAMWGLFLSGMQAAVLEKNLIPLQSWNVSTTNLLIGYTASTFALYSLAPLLFRTASASYFNISMLTSDFYGLLFGLFLFHYSPYWLYFPAFGVVISGLFIYFWDATPEEQGESKVQIPAYVSAQYMGEGDLEG